MFAALIDCSLSYEGLKKTAKLIFKLLILFLNSSIDTLSGMSVGRMLGLDN
jgi:hypothetical protein